MNRSFKCELRRALIANALIAVIPALIYWTFARRVTVQSLAGNYLEALLFSNLIGGMAEWALPRTWPLTQRFRSPWNWAARGAMLMGFALIGSFAALLILLAAGWVSPEAFWPYFANSLKIAAIVTLFFGGGLTAYEGLRRQLEQTNLDLRTRELERERALQLATQARLASLESRIHPHFLFNTLNSISALIREDPAGAERLLERLAALLRFSLDAPAGGLVPLERELRIVSDYLEIERTRFGERLRFSLNVPDELLQVEVPPLSVQSLVENSVKHVISPNRGGGEIRISAAGTREAFRIEVTDDGPGFALNRAPAGHGLENLRSRLQTLFGERATLTASQRGGACVVAMEVLAA
ncbi:MAG: histidine kinase [Acidobacteriota bacterium]|nr:histidine kinase [Acidobacteriota bacterium]